MRGATIVAGVTGLVAMLAPAACTPCHDVEVRDEVWWPAGLTGDGHDDRAMAVLASTVREGEGRVRVVLVERGGRTTPLAEVAGEPSGPVEGVSGRTSALWRGALGACASLTGVARLLVSATGGGARCLVIAARGVEPAAVAFDGVAYQAFWLEDTLVKHRRIDEDGTLGPVHTLFQDAALAEASAITDGAGRTWLRTGDGPGRATAVWTIDPTAGVARRLWSVPSASCTLATTDVWFAGAIRVKACHERGVDTAHVMYAIDPATGEAREDPIGAPVRFATALQARGATLLVLTGDHARVVDATYAEVTSFGDGDPRTTNARPVVFGLGLLRAEGTDAQVDAVAIDAGGAEHWRRALATSSTPYEIEECRPLF